MLRSEDTQSCVPAEAAKPAEGELAEQVARRRTFAIISHPDAGKTTLTEKLLLYGGAIHLAGSIKQRRGGRQTTSDWMEMERQRGISITTSVLQFGYRGKHMNLLDTPGHNDFSEDTYRTLAAADSAVMLIDSVKGVEPQTVKLFRVCRQRGIPIVTFINKMDRYGRPPLDLLDEIEKALGIPCAPANWPIGAGSSFAGVFDRWDRRVLLFERVAGGADAAPVSSCSLDDDDVRNRIEAQLLSDLKDDLNLLDEAGNAFDRERFLAGELTPVFFGSAMTNFGVEPFLDKFVDLAPPPRGRLTSAGELAPDTPRFSGFVFKVQANMDPNHRDRIAFVRVCSGRFVRGMQVQHVRTRRTLSLSKPLMFLAQERALIEEAYSGDIIGLWDPGVLRIGDTLCEPPELEFAGIPRFSPEHFVRLRVSDPMTRKRLAKGIEQLGDEGAVQVFWDRRRQDRDPVLGAVGWLQFEVIQYRLRSEYGVLVEFDRLPYERARWITPVEPGATIPYERFERPGKTICLIDLEDRPILLADDEWTLKLLTDDLPGLRFDAFVQPGRARRGA